MEVFLDIFKAGTVLSLDLLDDIIVQPGVCVAKIHGTRKRFPHLATKSIWESDLNQAGTLRVSQQREISTVG